MTKPGRGEAGHDIVSEHSGWLRDFQRRMGRPLRVLHFGNIANNGYLNAKALRRIGVHADVLCNDYYHIMGCPEWEDAELTGDWGDDFQPDWKAAGVRSFERPEWFIQGPLGYCASVIIQRYDKNPWRRFFARLSLKVLPKRQSTRVSSTLLRQRAVLTLLRREIGLLPRLLLAPLILLYLVLLFFGLGLVLLFQLVLEQPRVGRGDVGIGETEAPKEKRGIIRIVQLTFAQGLRLARYLHSYLTRSIGLSVDEWWERNESRLLWAFRQAFPARAPLRKEELRAFRSVLPLYHRLFSYYDVVQCYATNPMYPMLTGDRPYVAYEHGTIRNIPFQDDVIGKLAAISYREADYVFITNCDNQQAAERLGIPRYSFIPHPVNEDGLDSPDCQTLYEAFHREHDTDFVLLHPSRQHWSEERHPDWEKGNDHLIRGLARFVREQNPRALAVFVEWGRSVEDSKKLLEELGIADRVIWIPPQANRAFVRYIQRADVVADQFFLGAFGSLTPKAMACGRPVLLYLDEKQHRWAFPEMPPVENVRTADEIAEALTRLYRDGQYRAGRQKACREWYQKYHSMDRIVSELLSVYRGLLPHRDTEGMNGERR